MLKEGKKSLNDLTLISSPSKRNDTTENALKYARSEFENTYSLGFRELPLFFEKYSSGNKAIDYGCGAGRSTRFLRANGFQTIGLDISSKMLRQAKRLDQTGHYMQIKSGQIPFFNESCDLALCSFVLLTISSKNKILSIFREIHRCLTDSGIFIIVTGSEKLYSYEWVSYKTTYIENNLLQSGDKVKILLKDLGIEFINYYWTDRDYKEIFQASNFQILEQYSPYGNSNEKIAWLSEKEHSPYTIYMLQKK